MPKILPILALAVAGAFALPSGAFAHAHLIAATPLINGTVSASPAELDLKFSEDLNLKFTGLKITGPKKAAVKTGAASLKDNNTMLVVPIPQPLAPGVYLVVWHALSGDGHKTNGTYTFTLKP